MAACTEKLLYLGEREMWPDTHVCRQEAPEAGLSC